ncbi:outer membrane receptor protein [Bifidobacterium thermophilum RBL67]|uniref:Outer membrane receptor protein n=1 Tax=Bifidobacterium thermophilum RBL67 TaxID=1254439 RepID=M4REU2_9BIFI|nr:outer membrane receptor protein [Bifidobacterium thermophilum RBL67]
MVHDEHDDRADGDAVELHAADREGEVGDADNHRDGRGHHVDRLVEVDMVVHPDAHADHADHAIQQGGHAAEHAGGNGVDHGTELRAQAQNQGERRRTPVGGRRIHLRGSHDADVLAVRSRAGAAAEAGNRGADTIGHERGANLVVIIAAGHLCHGLDVAHVLGDQHEHDRNEHRENREIDLRQMELRQTDPGGAFHCLEIDLAAGARVRIADQYAQQDVQTPDQAAEQHADQQDGDQRHHSRVRGLLEVRPHRRGEVEADDRHNRAVDHRRHDLVNPLGAGEMDKHAHQGEQQTGDHDAEACDRDALVGRGDRRNRGDEAEGATEVAWQFVLVDEQEQRRRHGGEEQGRRRVEAGENRNQEGRAEHRDDMLGADTCGARPRQALVGFDHLPGFQGLAVTMQFPCEQAATHLLLLCLLGIRRTHMARRRLAQW